MALPDSLQVGLKEWASVCRALSTGRQILLLRKGGILEAIGGFELEHPRFLLFPTYLHQNPAMLKPDARQGVEPRTDEPATVDLSLAGEVVDIVRLKSRPQMDALDADHVWTKPLIDMRYNYRPANPLYLLLVRAYRLPAPLRIDNTPEYAGCKSWVPLDHPIPTTNATPVLDDATFNAQRHSILDRLHRAGA